MGWIAALKQGVPSEGKLTVDGVSVNGICGGIQNIHVGEMGD